ncbi:DUF1641 domain-containing protein [Bacillus sp. E214]|uniref:DUF1641 domain-containing protein n=1 Tax=Bacillus sp. E214 TaxID=2587156 RepID=UPI0011E06E63|nr:DUF1641 domain-containing protein [Bacillus sp. E214]
MSDTMKQQSETQSSPVASQEELLKQLSKPEVQESLVTLLNQLPQLTEVVTALNKSYEFAQSVATDKVLVNDFANTAKEFAEPVTKTAKHIAVNAMEAKERAEQSKEVISVFGLMKMLKDPQIQKVLRFASAYLQVSNERSK